MTDEIHGEYPPNANQVDHVWVDPYGKVSSASTDRLTGEKIREIAEKMEGELFLPRQTPDEDLLDLYRIAADTPLLHHSILSGVDSGVSAMMGQPALHISQGAYTDPEVRLVSGDRAYRLDKLVDAMIASMEALAEVISLCPDSLMPPQVRAQRSIENVLRKFDEARIL